MLKALRVLFNVVAGEVVGRVPSRLTYGWNWYHRNGLYRFSIGQPLFCPQGREEGKRHMWKLRAGESERVGYSFHQGFYIIVSQHKGADGQDEYVLRKFDPETGKQIGQRKIVAKWNVEAYLRPKDVQGRTPSGRMAVAL